MTKRGIFLWVLVAVILYTVMNYTSGHAQTGSQTVRVRDVPVGYGVGTLVPGRIVGFSCVEGPDSGVRCYVATSE